MCVIRETNIKENKKYLPLGPHVATPFLLSLVLFELMSPAAFSTSTRLRHIRRLIKYSTDADLCPLPAYLSLLTEPYPPHTHTHLTLTPTPSITKWVWERIC